MKAFCINCAEDEEYELKEEPDTIDIGKQIVNYNSIYAVCKKCGGRVYVQGLDGENVKRILKEL